MDDDKLINDVLKAQTLRDFLNLMEAYFKDELINRYLYIFLPSESRFDAETIEFHHFG